MQSGHSEVGGNWTRSLRCMSLKDKRRWLDRNPRNTRRKKYGITKRSWRIQSLKKVIWWQWSLLPWSRSCRRCLLLSVLWLVSSGWYSYAKKKQSVWTVFCVLIKIFRQTRGRIQLLPWHVLNCDQLPSWPKQTRWHEGWWWHWQWPNRYNRGW